MAGNVIKSWTPIMGSVPISTLLPQPTWQERLLPSHGRVIKNPFQKNDAPRVLKCLPLSQVSTESFLRYLLTTASCQRPSFCRANRIFFNLRAMLNHYKFFIPHPPYEYGQERHFQSDRWYRCLLSDDPQRNAYVRLLSLFKTDTGTGARPNQ